MHSDLALAPPVVSYVPSGHGWQNDSPGVDIYCPGVHEMHSESDSDGEYCPARQSEQVDDPESPEYWPMEQLKHDVAPVASEENCPGAHATHIDRAADGE